MRREFVLRAVSHNVQSLRQPESIELVISFMRERGVDIYAVQETWREGSGGWKTSLGKAAKNVDLIKILLAWMAAYGSLILFVHIYSHTGKDDPLSVGNDGADRMAVAGAKAGRGDQAAIQRIALRSPRPAR